MSFVRGVLSLARGGGYIRLFLDEGEPLANVLRAAASHLREGLLLSPGKHLLQAEQSFEYARPIVAGDKLTVRSKVVEVSQRNTPSGLTDVVVIEDEGKDETGAVVYRSRQLWVVRTAPKQAPGDLHE